MDPLLGCAFSKPAIIQYVKLRYGIAVHGVTDQHSQKCVFYLFLTNKHGASLRNIWIFQRCS